MERNVLCERGEYAALTEYLEELSELLKDSDDKEMKERIQSGLKQMAEPVSYLVLGEEGVGKTSLLRMIFKDIMDIKDDMAGDICEYRWGEKDFEMPVKDGVQKKFISSDHLQGIELADTRGINRMGESALRKIRERASQCSVIFAVFDASNIKTSRMWDVIENVPEKRMVFFVTKCDAVPPETLNANLEKLKVYMQEANITSPVFPVNLKEDGNCQDIPSLETMRQYIRRQVIGENPLLNKQRENIEEIKSMFLWLRASFIQRNKQYESDAEILEKINTSLDSYIANHREIITEFTKKLAVEIGKDIDGYEQEIISKLDPFKIRERFENQNDFIDYMNMVNDNYKTMMNQSVNQKTIQAMKECMSDLEIMYQEAVGYFNEREEILALNDRFYGSLLQSRNKIAAKTKEAAVSAGEFYRNLSDASEELFLQIWNERKVYDSKITKHEIGATATGAVGIGATAAAVVFNAIVATAAVASLGFAIGAIIGGGSFNYAAKRIFNPKAGEKMEENVQVYIRKFKNEVSETRKITIEQVTGQVMELFERELASVDGCFTDFRISVNVEGEKLPLLQQKLEKVGMLEERIRKIERTGR